MIKPNSNSAEVKPLEKQDNNQNKNIDPTKNSTI